MIRVRFLYGVIIILYFLDCILRNFKLFRGLRFWIEFCVMFVKFVKLVVYSCVVVLFIVVLIVMFSGLSIIRLRMFGCEVICFKVFLIFFCGGDFIMFFLVNC